MNKILFIARYCEGISTGASVITMRNLDMLRKVHGEESVQVLWLHNQSNMLVTLFYTLILKQAGVNYNTIKEIKNKITTGNVTHVFIDTSLAGICAKTVKKTNNQIKVFLFFHNAELSYFKSLIFSTFKLWHLLTLIAVWFNEKLGVKYADHLLFLNNRDYSDVLRQHPTANIKKYEIIPTSMHDRFDERLLLEIETKSLNVLFVGTLFFPNYHGVKWFLEKVFPHVDINLTIVGRGFENVAADFNHPNVNVVGTVDNIDPYYYNCDLVVAPIFKGSGMKTKLAEALMFGKSIFASSESFQGYDIDFEKVGALCNNENEFISAIKNFKRHPFQFNKASRDYFLSHYDFNKSCDIYNRAITS